MVHAILSDLHGNLEALEAVLADLDRVKPASVVCLGDFVGYGASPNECIERLKPRLEEAVIGNHDLAAIGKLALRGFHEDAAAAARWTGAALTPGNRAWLESLPYDRTWRGAVLRGLRNRAERHPAVAGSRHVSGSGKHQQAADNQYALFAHNGSGPGRSSRPGLPPARLVPATAPAVPQAYTRYPPNVANKFVTFRSVLMPGTSRSGPFCTA